MSWGEPLVIRNREPFFDHALICMNGHVVNSRVLNSPEKNVPFCGACGEPTTKVCLACKALIRGDHFNGMAWISARSAPAYCEECGKAHIWTENALNAAIEMSQEIEEFTVDDKAVFAREVVSITKNSPNAEVSATRLMRLTKKAASASGKVLENILVKVASETASKVILSQTGSRSSQ
jgi:hypothetical protein